MGVAKAWRFSLIPANLAVLQQQNGYNGKDVCWRSVSTTSPQQKKPYSWSLVCGLMLFGLGLISLFTGHVASDLEWYSQRLGKHSLYTKLVSLFLKKLYPLGGLILVCIVVGCLFIVAIVVGFRWS